MISDEIRQKLQDIVRGNVLESKGDSCTAITNLLRASFGSGPTVKREFESRSILKEKQAQFLRTYAKENGLWLDGLPARSQYLTRGGESVVYFAPDIMHVYKVNDAVYYATWTEYFTSLLIHNLVFFETAYDLLGFLEDKERGLCAVLSQPFIVGEQVSLDELREYLTFNGFQNIKRQDYFMEEFGLLLEDMHDENVIASEEALFFVDTVFYIMEKK